MSFGFGQNNNQSTGFGGFGSNNTSSGFGQPQTNTGTGFGGSTLFGSNTQNSTGGFGSGTGFGSAPASNSAFGQNRPAFGSSTTTTSGGGLFGGGTATAGTSSGFGGFGTNNNSNASNGGLFGSNTQKPAFGGGGTTGGLFGSGNTGGGFGQTNNQTTSGFGSGMSSALGQNNAECQGTGGTPFSPWTEKEGTTGNTTNHFQSISFMPPYQNFSFEELRAADYNGGRRFGNNNGQAGAFGQTNFGGFGQGNNAFGQSQSNTGGGLFGGTATTSAPAFGGTQTASSGFGTGSGSLFSQNKPAGGSLFGTTSSSGTTGGLFGTTNNSGGGFGTNNTSSGFGTGGSLFGQQNNNQQQQSKPLFGTSTGGTTGGFGTGGTGFGTGSTNTNTGGSLFGNTQSNPFGQPQQQQNQNPFGGFGQNQNQNNTAPAFGGFGQSQQQEQKPGGLFGNQQSSNTGSGLFGNLGNNNQQQNTGGGLFGQPQNNSSASTNSLFNKPATTGSLFNTSNTSATNTGGGLFSGFGNTNNASQNQQNQGGGLFGNTNSQQQKPSLFSNNQSNTGGGLFGNMGSSSNTQQQGGNSLFGNNNQQQQPLGGLFGNTNNNPGPSLFGSQQQQQQPNVFAPPSNLNQSLTDPGSAYGSPSIFSGLPPPPVHVGPIATPINVKQKMKRSAILPQYKLNPNSSSRLVTPQKRGGFGFSYSTYGTPGSASSNASTPGGLSSSLLYGSVGRGLGKSLSTSNLRRNFDSDSESILTPGAFSAGSNRYSGTGSLKRLTIDRSLRTDLFSDKGSPALPSPEKIDQSKQPSILKKKVSFDTSTVGGNGENQDGLLTNGSNGGSGSDKENSATPSAEEQGFLRTPSRSQRGLGPKVNGTPQQPESEQVPRGNELAIVHEDEPDTSNAQTTRAQPKTQEDQQPGNYWMKPSAVEISKMSQEEKRKVKNFSVGREGCGYVEFNSPVDLTLAPVNDLFGKIVLIELRSITVYPDQTKKPAQGKGLNVPSTLYLENSWPRQRDRRTPLHEKSGPRFQKHVDRLRKVGGTEFVRYEKDTGIWVFKVPHFTTYGFEYDEDETEGESLQASVQDEGLGSSVLSAAPDTPTPKSHFTRNGRAPTTTDSTQRSFATTNESSQVSSSPDDTFQFRKKKMIAPGAFDEGPAYEEEPIYEDDNLQMQEINHDRVPFLDQRSASSSSGSDEDEPSDMYEMSGALHEDRSLVIHDEDDAADVEMAGAFPSAGTEEALPTLLSHGTPSKTKLDFDGEWAEELQRTISPRKQDRQALRETQKHVLEDREAEEDTFHAKNQGPTKSMTPIDLMNSIFGEQQARRSGRNAKQATKGKGLKLPYQKKSKVDDGKEMDAIERDFHESYKPAWGPGATLLYAIPGKVDITKNQLTQADTVIHNKKGRIVSEGRDIQFAKFTVSRHLTPAVLVHQRSNTSVSLDNGVPRAELKQTPFKNNATLVQPDSPHEKTAWELASILFDEQNTDQFGIPAAERATYDDRIRRDRLISLWEQLCQDTAKQAVSAAQTAEERAFAHLSAHKVVEACDALVKGRDFRLAILAAQIGGGKTMREDMENQISAWRDLKVLSEMTEPIRAIYSLLAGNVSVCEGTKGPTEDRARTFVISERFDLDWKRAFGLRLFYAILAEEPIEAAVVKFANDLQAEEGKKPRPWFIEDPSSQTPWQDPKPNKREDILWGLLKLYAASKSALPTPSIAETFAPQNTTGSPLDTRLSFQLYHALTQRFPSSPAATPFQADALAWTFASQLDSAGEWLWAIFALLHLSSCDQRHMAIQSLLALHAADITVEGPSNECFRTLTEELKVPAEWIYEAKALFARNVEKDHVKVVSYLIKAGDWQEAHDVLKTEVGPTAVIEEDWNALEDVLDAFEPGKDSIEDWGQGGQVYRDYLALVSENMDKDERKKVLDHLLGALPDMVHGEKTLGFREVVAVREISGAVGREVLALEEKGMDNGRVLQLPLAKDNYLKHTRELSLQYYKAVMAKG